MSNSVNLRNGKQSCDDLHHFSPAVGNDLWKSKKNVQVLSPGGAHPDQVTSQDEELFVDRVDALDEMDSIQVVKTSDDSFSGLQGKTMIPSPVTATSTNQWQAEGTVTADTNKANRTKLHYMERVPLKQKNLRQKVIKAGTFTFPAYGFGYKETALGILFILTWSVGGSKYEMDQINATVGEMVRLLSFDCSEDCSWLHLGPNELHEQRICVGMTCVDRKYTIEKQDSDSCYLTFCANASTSGSYRTTHDGNDMSNTTKVKLVGKMESALMKQERNQSHLCVYSGMALFGITIAGLMIRNIILGYTYI